MRAGAATTPRRPKVVIVRGHQPNPWELGAWEQRAISDRFDVSYLRTHRGWFDTRSIGLPSVRISALRDLLPPGRVGDALVRLPGDRYLGLHRKLREADIVHTQELGYWYSMQAARLKARLGFKLVTTVWETIPFLDAYRNVRTRPYRAATLAATDLFLAATERAKAALLLEGAQEARIRVCPPGISTERFFSQGANRAGNAARRDQASAGDGTPREEAGAEDVSPRPLILSPGRLVWEKGHQDVLRALAMLRKGMVAGRSFDVELCIVGEGPERARLQSYARELGVEDAVVFRGFIAYDEMPTTFRRSACMVLAEAMVARVPILASSSGAIPEVTGEVARLFSPGDWPTLARQLADTLQARRNPDFDAQPPDVGVWRYSTEAAAQRLAAAYEELLGDGAAAAVVGKTDA